MNIDERLEALTTSLELNQAQLAALERKVDSLTNLAAVHEQEWERFRRAMRAGFREFFRDDDNSNGDAQ
jgi:hypothetical protein